jgi:hypothetical protein
MRAATPGIFLAVILLLVVGFELAHARTSGDASRTSAEPQPVTVCQHPHWDPSSSSSSISSKLRRCTFARVSDALISARPHGIIIVEQGHYIEERHHNRHLSASAADHSSAEVLEEGDWVRVRANNVTLRYMP